MLYLLLAAWVNLSFVVFYFYLDYFCPEDYIVGILARFLFYFPSAGPLHAAQYSFISQEEHITVSLG